MNSDKFEQYVQKCTEVGDFISFKTECGCYAHDLTVFFEVDDLFKQIVFVDDVYFDEECEQNQMPNKTSWWKKICFRLKTAFIILFKGRIQIEHGFVFKNDTHLKQFIDFINHGYEKINNLNSHNNE